MTESEKDRLYKKFHVERTDGLDDPSAFYFVLRLDDNGDPYTTRAARIAMLNYAKGIEAYYPGLAEDIRTYILAKDGSLVVHAI